MKKTLNLLVFAAVAFVSLFVSAPNAGAQVFTVVSLEGRILNAATREPVAVQATLYDENNKKVVSTNSNLNEGGTYYFTGLKPAKTYSVVIYHPDFFKEKFEIKVPDTDKYYEISRDFYLKPLKVGSEIPIMVSPYETHKSKIRAGADEFLIQWIRSLTSNPNVKFEIRCFADNNNNVAENKTLTEQRAASLKEFFVKNGIIESFISTKGEGMTDPKNPPPTEKRSKGKRYVGTTYIVVTGL